MASRDIHQIFTGTATRNEPQVRGAIDGTIDRITDGKAYVVSDAFTVGQHFGPIRWGRTDTPPHVGDNCTLVFVGMGIDKPRLICWWPPE